MKKIRVRFAPSPTGALHLGGVRTALFNYLFALKHQGDFLLRIEDTDQTRYVKGAEEYIIESLRWCGIEYNEGVGKEGNFGPYRQSDRKEIYKQYADKLIENGGAYFAFDTPEELEEMRKHLESIHSETQQYDAKTRKLMKNSLTLPENEVKERIAKGEPYVIRIKTPENEKIVVQDLIRGAVKFHSEILDDKVLFKSDGMPTYHLANVVDDHLMQISHVIRGEEWLPSTPLHVLLYRFWGWENEMPQFAHLPLILKPDGNGKLSKRDGLKLGFPVYPLRYTDPSTSEVSEGYREWGYLPEAFINMLAFLGWNPGTEQEIFSLNELVDAFSLEKVSKAGAKFDLEKAKWFNHQYLRTSSNQKLTQLFQHFLKQKNIFAENHFVEKVCEVIKERCHLVSEFWGQGFYFFEAPKEYDSATMKKVWKTETPQILCEVKELIKNCSEFSAENLEKIVKNLINEKQYSVGIVFNSLRLAMVGKNFGIDLFKIFEILGKNEVLNRIEAILN